MCATHLGGPRAPRTSSIGTFARLYPRSPRVGRRHPLLRLGLRAAMPRRVVLGGGRHALFHAGTRPITRRPACRAVAHRRRQPRTARPRATTQGLPVVLPGEEQDHASRREAVALSALPPSVRRRRPRQGDVGSVLAVGLGKGLAELALAAVPRPSARRHLEEVARQRRQAHAVVDAPQAPPAGSLTVVTSNGRYSSRPPAPLPLRGTARAATPPTSSAFAAPRAKGPPAPPSAPARRSPAASARSPGGSAVRSRLSTDLSLRSPFSAPVSCASSRQFAGRNVFGASQSSFTPAPASQRRSGSSAIRPRKQVSAYGLVPPVRKRPYTDARTAAPARGTGSA